MKSPALALLIGVFALAGSPSVSQTGPKSQVNALLKACRDNAKDRSFRVLIGCEGAEGDPQAAAEDMAMLQPDLCRKLDRQCGSPQTKDRANDLANALGCAQNTMAVCRINSPGGGSPYDLCQGQARLTEFYSIRDRLLVTLETKSGKRVSVPFDIDQLKPPPGALQQWMRENTSGDGSQVPDPTLSAFKAHLDQHCPAWLDPPPGKANISDLIEAQIREWIANALKEPPQRHLGAGGGVRG